MNKDINDKFSILFDEIDAIQRQITNGHTKSVQRPYQARPMEFPGYIIEPKDDNGILIWFYRDSEDPKNRSRHFMAFSQEWLERRMRMWRACQPKPATVSRLIGFVTQTPPKFKVNDWYLKKENEAFHAIQFMQKHKTPWVWAGISWPLFQHHNHSL